MEDTIAVGRRVYEKTARFYQARLEAECSLGYKFLYGPPYQNPPILFLSYQPGGGAGDFKKPQTRAFISSNLPESA